MQLSFSLALIAGLVSFLSPCVLPLVPAYIGYMGGRVTNTVAAQTAGGTAVAVKPALSSRFSTMLHGLAFVGGFTFVFVAIGLLGTAFVSQIGRANINVITDIIGRAGGLLIIFFGLHFMGVLPALFKRILERHQRLNTPLIALAAVVIVGAGLLWVFEDWLIVLPFFAVFMLWIVLGGALTAPEAFWTRAITSVQRALYTDTRRQMVAQGHQSYAGSAIMGVVFSAGWTPCIGPIYGSILTMAATGGNVATAGWLLLAYSLGLGIPFVAAAFLLDGAQGILRHLQRHLHTIELLSGAFLIVIGIFVASGRLQTLSQNFANQFADFSYNLEDCVLKLNQGEIALGDFTNCMNGTTLPPEASVTEGTSSTIAAHPDATEAPLPSLAIVAAPSILDLAADAPAAPETGLEVGKQAPNFTTITASGSSINLADLRGSVVLLNFWATWCGPCRSEMPAFQQAYAEKADQGFMILGVNDAETLDDIAGFRDEFGLTFPLLLDQNAIIQDLYGVRSYPSTLILDRNGVIAAQHYGPLTADQIADLIQQALA